jgi:GT2 family glycosyltransferase
MGTPLVSLVVLVYHKLDYTKQCIESLYRYTSHLDTELITINNGSTAYTQRYFDGLPNLKKLAFTENQGADKRASTTASVSLKASTPSPSATIWC